MVFERLMVGSMGVNCYILGCDETKEAAVIDPGGNSDQIIKVVESKGLDVKYVINTHGHVDHITANEDVTKATGAKLLIHEEDSAMLEDPKKNLSIFVGGPISQKPADKILRDGDTITIGNLELEVIHTPGHTLGGISLLVKNENILFSGDTLFAESIGRSDFPGGCHNTLISSIKTRLLTLPKETKVYPGHGPETTIGHEAENNPFF